MQMRRSIREGLVGLLVIGLAGCTGTVGDTAGSGGSSGSSGSGGSTNGSGGSTNGSGGSTNGSGGSTNGSGGSTNGSGGSTNGSGGSTGTGGMLDPGAKCMPGIPSTSQVPRMTRLQYATVVNDLLGATLPPDTLVAGVPARVVRSLLEDSPSSGVRSTQANAETSRSPAFRWQTRWAASTTGSP